MSKYCVSLAVLAAAVMALPAWSQQAPEPEAAQSAAAAAQPVAAAPAKVDRAEKVLDGFVKALEANSTLDAAKRTELVTQVQALRKDPERVGTVVSETLMATTPEFRDALTALADENNVQATALLTKLVESQDPYLRAESAFYLARAYLSDQKAEQALPLLMKLTGEWADHTVLSGEAQYLLGTCQGQLLDRVAAIKSLAKFLDENPNAPERLLVSAVRQVEELAAIEREKGRLLDIEDRMGFSRRKLETEDSGDRTRTEQDKIVAMLDVLIKEAEDMEQGNCSGCKGGGRGRGGPGGRGMPGGGAARSAAPGGPGSVGKLGRAVNSRNAWDVLRDKEREKVLAGLKGKFPDRYKKLIEQYYKNLQEEEK